MGRKAPSSTPLLIPLDRESSIPRFQQIFDSIREAILSGRLRPGQQIPSTRLLAQELGVARSTVVLAYDNLTAEGYLDGMRGAGTFVSSRLPDVTLVRPAPRRLPSLPDTNPRPTSRRLGTYNSLVLGAPLASRAAVPFRIGEPALDAFPVKSWERLYDERWRRNGGGFLRYGEANGYLPLREAITAYLGTARGVMASADQLILVRGVQQALHLVSRVLLDPGDTVWIEDPGYLTARAAFLAASARIAPVPVDREGLDVAAGQSIAPGARLAYVTPSHQFPLGVTMSLNRRLALLNWANQAGAWIIEDDYDSEFRYASQPLTALRGLDTSDRVIYVGTFSKTLFPALRLGYLVVPRDLIPAFTMAGTLSDYMSPTIEQAVVSTFLGEGHFARHVRRMRSLYGERQAALVAAVSTELRDLARIEPSVSGMHLVMWLAAGIDDVTASNAALTARLEAPPLSLYCMNASYPPGLLLGYAAVDEAAIRLAVRRLRDVLLDQVVGHTDLVAC